MTSKQPSHKPFRTEPEEAEYVGRSINALRKWRAQGIGPPFVKPRGTKLIIYFNADTEEWLAASRVETRGAA